MPHRDTSNEYPQHMFSWRNKKNIYNRDTLSSQTPASVAQLGAPSDWRPGGRGFNPCRGRQHSFVEIDHEIFSTVFLSLPMIEEGRKNVHNTG